MHKENLAIKFKDKYITNENELTKTFNSHYSNIVNNTTGKMSLKIRSSASNNDDTDLVKEIIEKCFFIRNSVYIREKF